MINLLTTLRNIFFLEQKTFYSPMMLGKQLLKEVDELNEKS